MKLGLSTESLARRSGRHPWLTIGAWLVVLVVAVILVGTSLGDALSTEDNVTNNPESKQADTLMEERLAYLEANGEETDEEIIIVQSETYTVDDPEYKTYIETLYADLMALGDEVVVGGVHYYNTGAESLVSADRHTTLMPLTMPDGAEDVVEEVHVVADHASENASFAVMVTGAPSINSDAMELAEETMSTGETLGIGVALIVLAIVFGALAAAFLPIAMAIIAVVAALGLTALVGQTMELSFFVTNMITMMGLAVGIDYSLFVVSRYREERAKGLDKVDAIAMSGKTASRAVLFSGMTVVLALCGLVIFPLSIFQSMGIGCILVVIVAVMASLTLLPALLGLFGDRINRLRIPVVGSKNKTESKAESPSGFWAWTTRQVTRQPVVSLIIASGLLIAAVVPYFDANMGMNGVDSFPDDMRAKQGFVVLQEEFDYALDAPAVIVIDGPTDSEAVQGAVAQLEADINSSPAFIGSNLEIYSEANLAVLYAEMDGDPMAKEAMDAVSALRTEHIPAAFGDVPARALVTGDTAGTIDFNETTATYTPIIFAIVLGLSFILLMVAFRSIVVPAKAILMNLLSVGAAYGMLVLVFQKGIGASLFGFQQVDVIESWIPLFLFAILFGLSMDYHVFILSRIREHYKKTGDNSAAVCFGVRSTGRLITGAALIMVAVFGGFALGDLVMFQEMGFGLAVAVLMDATIVRCVLVPASMKLLGKWNWYFPSWLEWLPNISVGEADEEEAQPARKAWGGGPVAQPIPVPVPVAVYSSQNDNMRLHHDEAIDQEDGWS